MSTIKARSRLPIIGNRIDPLKIKNRYEFFPLSSVAALCERDNLVWLAATVVADGQLSAFDSTIGIRVPMSALKELESQ